MAKKRFSMLKVIISPAKKLNFEDECPSDTRTRPELLEKSGPLIKKLKTMSSVEIGKLMKLSDSLSELNYKRYQSFTPKKIESLGKQAAFAFNGDTYTGLDINSFNKKELDYAQKHLKILSGLYGVLRPMDLILPYRLEMGTKLKFDQYKNLYDYWKKDITDQIVSDLNKDDLIINCASQEYFKAVDEKLLSDRIITPVFKELRNGEYKIISFSAKKARGMMAKFILKNRIKNIEDLKNFNEEKYKYNSSLSEGNELVFTR